MPKVKLITRHLQWPDFKLSQLVLDLGKDFWVLGSFEKTRCQFKCTTIDLLAVFLKLTKRLSSLILLENWSSLLQKA